MLLRVNRPIPRSAGSYHGPSGRHQCGMDLRLLATSLLASRSIRQPRVMSNTITTAAIGDAGEIGKAFTIALPRSRAVTFPSEFHPQPAIHIAAVAESRTHVVPLANELHL